MIKYFISTILLIGSTLMAHDTTPNCGIEVPTDPLEKEMFDAYVDRLTMDPGPGQIISSSTASTTISE